MQQVTKVGGQLQLPMEHQPGACPNEGATVDIGGGKSYCIPWERWTNCRECGHCVMMDWSDE